MRLRFRVDGSVTVVTGAVRRVNAAVAALLVATAVLLVLGVALERHAEAGAESHSVSETVGEDEGHHEESGETTHDEADVHGDEDSAGESVTVDAIESPWVVALGTLAAAALAVAVWRRPTRPVVALVVAFTSPRWSSTFAKSATRSARVAPVSSFSLG